MESIRLRGVCARVSDERLLDRVKNLRETLGNEYRIIIEREIVSVSRGISEIRMSERE